MKHTEINQTFDSNGILISEKVVEVIDYPSQTESLIAAARLIVRAKLQSDELKDEDADQYAGLFPDLALSLSVLTGEIYRWDGALVEALEDHITQEHLMPTAANSLWKIHQSSGDKGVG